MYRRLLEVLINNPDPHVVRDQDMYSEIIGCTLYVDDADTLDFDVAGRPSNRAYKYTEALWDLGPSDEIEVLQRVNPNMTRFVKDQPEQTWEYATWAYGPQINLELERVAHHLYEDPTSRRAVISLPRSSRILGTPPCLVSIQFLVRDEKVHCVVNMRSNDVWLGVPLDVFQFNLMQQLVAGYLMKPVGSYIHHAASMHLYNRDTKAAENVLSTEGRWTLSSKGADTTYPPMVKSIGAMTHVSDGVLHSALQKATMGLITFSEQIAPSWLSYLNVIYGHQVDKAFEKIIG